MKSLIKITLIGALIIYLFGLFLGRKKRKLHMELNLKYDILLSRCETELLKIRTLYCMRIINDDEYNKRLNNLQAKVNVIKNSIKSEITDILIV